MARLNWGERDREITLYDAAEPSLGNRRDSVPGRPLRPLPPLRVGGGVLVAPLDGPDSDRRRYAQVKADLGSLSVLFDSDAAAAGVLVDLAVDRAGGLYVLEFLYGDTPTNRLRRLDGEGHTRWSRNGPVDHASTEPRRLQGVYTRLQVSGDGTLWLIPAATSAGLASIEPSTGQTSGVVPLDDDVADPVISPAGVAYFASISDHSVDDPHPLLAATDLTSGHTTLVPCGDVPLLDLAGVDSESAVYARARDGIVQLAPDGSVRAVLQLAGVVVHQNGASISVAQPASHDGADLQVTMYSADGTLRRWTFAPNDSLAIGQTTLVDHDPVADRFLFQVGGSSRRPGKLVSLHGDGSFAGPIIDGDQAASDLYHRESRIDPTTAQVDDDGTVYLTVADSRGYSILAWQPSAVGRLRSG